AKAKEDTCVNMVIDTEVHTLICTPEERTLSERAAKILASWSCSPKSFTSVAPGAEKRSVIWSPIAALRLARSRVKPAMRVPMVRAGKRNTGNNNRDTSVFYHDVVRFTYNFKPNLMSLLNTFRRVSAIYIFTPLHSLVMLTSNA